MQVANIETEKKAPILKKKKTQNEISLKGAFASVMILGAFIIVSWFGIYALFLSRF